MTDFRGLKGFALARESAFFKLEQEADIQKHRSRLVTQGRIEEVAGGYLMPRRQQTFAESAKSFEVLAEVLQQQVRLDDPTAAQRRNFFRRMKSQLPKLTEAEMRKYRSSVYGVAALASLPRVHLGRDKYVRHTSQHGQHPPLKLSPEAQEAAQRAFNSGARSLLYGSVLAAATVLLTVGLTARLLGGGSTDELRARVLAAGSHTADAARERLLPVQASLQNLFGGREGAERRADSSQLSQRLSSKFRPGLQTVPGPGHDQR